MGTKIKAIVFDMNGVFVKEPEKRIIEKVCNQTGFGKFIAVSNFALSIHAFELGQISPFQFWKKVFPFLSEEEYARVIESEYFLPFSTDPDLYALADSLSKKYDLYCLSNTNFLQGKEYRRQNLYKPFKALFLSHEHGAMKPFPAFYKKLIASANLKASECLFVDDSPLNCFAASLLGFRVVLYKNFHDFSKKLNALNIL